MDSFLDADGNLRGHSTHAALRELLRPRVRHAFERERTAFEDAGPSDPCDTALVATAHALRVAVAARWARSGRSPEEQQLADAVDRNLDQLRYAILAGDNAGYNHDWLADLWVGHQVDVDAGSWWGFQLLDDAEARYLLEITLAEARAEHAFPPPVPRHEHAWEAPPPGCQAGRWPEDWHPPDWYQVARERSEADYDMYADMAWDRG